MQREAKATFDDLAEFRRPVHASQAEQKSLQSFNILRLGPLKSDWHKRRKPVRPTDQCVGRTVCEMKSPYLKGYLDSGISIPRYLTKELKGTRQADHIPVYAAQLRYQCHELLLAGKLVQRKARSGGIAYYRVKEAVEEEVKPEEPGRRL